MKEKFNNMSKDFKEDFEFNAGGFYDGGISIEEKSEKELAPHEKNRKIKLVAVILWGISSIVCLLIGNIKEINILINIGCILGCLLVISYILVDIIYYKT